MTGKNLATRLTDGIKFVPGQVTNTTYGLRNLGNSPMITPVLATSRVYWMLRSIQSGSRPRVMNSELQGRDEWEENLHNGRPTNSLLLVLQTTFRMALNADTLFHSECSRD